VKVLILDAPQAMLDERRAKGLDGRDEMWAGVVHMVPPAGGPHQRLSARFFLAVAPLAQARGLVPLMETGLFRSAEDYRVPDQMYHRPAHGSERGAEGAELVVEVRSPEDETYEKLDFYASMGVREVIVLHPLRPAVELFRREDGVMRPVPPEAVVISDVVGFSVRCVGTAFRIDWDGGSVEI
jgi:Uma2 family endonuclease